MLVIIRTNGSLDLEVNICHFAHYTRVLNYFSRQFYNITLMNWIKKQDGAYAYASAFSCYHLSNFILEELMNLQQEKSQIVDVLLRKYLSSPFLSLKYVYVRHHIMYFLLYVFI